MEEPDGVPDGGRVYNKSLKLSFLFLRGIVGLQIRINCLSYHLTHTPAVYKIFLCFCNLFQPYILVFINIKRLPLPDWTLHLRYQGSWTGNGSGDCRGYPHEVDHLAIPLARRIPVSYW